MVYNNILEALGNTPMVRLNRMVPAHYAQVLVKYEGVNIGGSIKTRTAYNMILDGMRRGLVHENTIIVEPTSGNQGIGLALCGAVMGLKVRMTAPQRARPMRRRHGAEGPHHYAGLRQRRAA